MNIANSGVDMTTSVSFERLKSIDSWRLASDCVAEDKSSYGAMGK